MHAPRRDKSKEAEAACVSAHEGTGGCCGVAAGGGMLRSERHDRVGLGIDVVAEVEQACGSGDEGLRLRHSQLRRRGRLCEVSERRDGHAEIVGREMGSGAMLEVRLLGGRND